MSAPRTRPKAIVETAETFRQAFREICREYDDLSRQSEVLFEQLVGEVTEARVPVPSEYQLRWFLVDRVLAWLNWLSEGQRGQLLPEARIDAVASALPSDQHRCYLDYFGYEVDGGNVLPLLVTEVKRESEVPTPDWLRKVGDYRCITPADLSQAVEAPGSRALSGALEQLQEYCRACTQRLGLAPRRALLTNGAFFLVFGDVDGLLSADHTRNTVHLFGRREAVDAHASVLFGLLDYYHVSSQSSPLNLGQLRGMVAGLGEGARVECVNVVRVLRERISDMGGAPRKGAHIRVEPRAAVMVAGSRLCMVELSGPAPQVRSDDSSVQEHVQDTTREHRELQMQVQAELSGVGPLQAGGRVLTVASRHRIYQRDEAAFAAWPAVRIVPNAWVDQEIWILLGESSHYLCDPGPFRACPSHSHTGLSNARRLEIEPVFDARFQSPACHFADGSRYHCASPVVQRLKARSCRGVTVAALGRDDPRASGEAAGDEPMNLGGGYGNRSGERFCEFWDFEQRLCCRACAFWSVCEPHMSCMPCLPHYDEG